MGRGTCVTVHTDLRDVVLHSTKRLAEVCLYRGKCSSFAMEEPARANVTDEAFGRPRYRHASFRDHVRKGHPVQGKTHKNFCQRAGGASYRGVQARE